MSGRRVVVTGHNLVGVALDRLPDYLVNLGIWRELARMGTEVTCTCLVGDARMAEAAAELSSGRLTVLPLAAARRYPRALQVPRRGLAMLRSLEPDVVHCDGEPWQSKTLSGLRAGRHLGALAGAHFAENGPALRGPGGLLRRRRGRTALARADYAIGWSRAASRLAREVWGCRGPVRTFQGVAVADCFYRAGAHPQPREGVLFVGRLVPEKGVEEMLVVAHRLAPEGIRVRVVGSGPLRHRVEAAAADGVVEYLGRLPRTGVAELMAGARVTLAPSRPGVFRGAFGTQVGWEEQFGLVFAESLACGTPVVGYRSGAVPEVAGAAGLLVGIGDVDGLTAATRRLLEDGAEWERVAELARNRSLRYSEGSIAAQLSGLWDDLS